MRPRDRVIVVNGVRLHYLEWGDAALPAIVTIHGGSAHAHWWDLLAPTLTDQFRVVAVDLRGHGDSEHPLPAAYRLDDYARDLAELVDTLGLGTIHLVGHSLGAMVAAAYAGMRPDLLHTLTVVDSQLKISASGARYMLRLRNFPHPIYRTREQAIRRFRLLPTHTAADEQTLRHVAAHGVRELSDGRWTLKFDREALAQHDPQDLAPNVRDLRCPILFVRGAHSTLFSRPALDALLGAVPHAEAVEIPGAHHHVMLDNPGAFEVTLRTFLLKSRHRGSGPALEPRP